MEGWIKLHRKMKDHWIWGNPDYLKAWITILFNVNHEGNKVLIHGELIDCNKGQSLFSLQNWSKEFGKNWSIQRVRTFFELLKNDSMINTEGLRKTTRLTVCNYDRYQNEQQTNNRQKTFKQQTKNTQITTNKNDKEYKEEIIKEENLKTWKDDFAIYLEECKKGYKKFIEDSEKMKIQQKLNPNVNIKLTLEKGFVNYWGTEAGWKKKKASKSSTIDWERTIINSISINKVYYTKQELSLL